MATNIQDFGNAWIQLEIKITLEYLLKIIVKN